MGDASVHNGPVETGGAHSAARAAPRAFTGRALLIGLVCIGLVVIFIHWAELVLGSTRGHTALANTSIPVGPFFALFVVVFLNLAVRALAPRAALSQHELIVIYVMTAASAVVTSSGGIHFLVPTLTALFHFDTPENAWADLHDWVPLWLAPRAPDVIEPFYAGATAVPVRAWLVPVLVWSGFLLCVGFVTVCICTILQHQWVRAEKLTFPTVYVPLGMTEMPPAFWRNKVMWAGFALPFLIGTLNTLNANYPIIPKLEVRNIDISKGLTDPPLNAMRPLSLSFYPFIVGIAYLLSQEITLSSVVFFWATKAQYVFGSITGLNEWGSGLNYSRYPFLQHQGAGAFLAVTALALWAGRRYYGALVRAALRGREGSGDQADYPTWALWGLALGLALLIAFCLAAGMSPWPPTVLLVLSFVYMTSATRIRAETGNAWLYGPHVDPNMLMTGLLGARTFAAKDLTLLCYLSNLSSFDLRCLSMPHQLDGLKLADEIGLNRKRLTAAMLGGLLVAVLIGFWFGLFVWYRYGALAKLGHWRTLMGRAPFDRLTGYLTHPTPPDALGGTFVAAGFIVTTGLMLLRTRFVSWPLHPVGYALANTPTMGKTWMPFTIAWIAKSLVLRYGGARMYAQSLPFFLGLVVGDFFNGGFWTAFGCFVPTWHVYPVNW